MPLAIRYGPHPSQAGDLYLPTNSRPAVVCLLHGGFWKVPYGREGTAPVAKDLARRGLAVLNLGYRRTGEPGGGWPGTLDDVIAGLDHLARLPGQGVALDLARVVVMGHSAGGHLALLAASSSRSRQRPGVAPIAAIGLAPVVNLAEAHRAGSAGNAAAAFMGGSPSQVPALYRRASPVERLPLGVTQWIVHGMDDTVVPIQHSRAYVTAARAAGDEAELVEISGGGHMDPLDPASSAHAALCRRLFVDWRL